MEQKTKLSYLEKEEIRVQNITNNYQRFINTKLPDLLQENNIHVYHRQMYEDYFYFNAYNDHCLFGYIKDNAIVGKNTAEDFMFTQNNNFSSPNQDFTKTNKIITIAPITNLRTTNMISLIAAKEDENQINTSFYHNRNVNGIFNPGIISVKNEHGSYPSSSNAWGLNLLNNFKNEYVITKGLKWLIFHLLINWAKDNSIVNSGNRFDTPKSMLFEIPNNKNGISILDNLTNMILQNVILTISNIFSKLSKETDIEKRRIKIRENLFENYNTVIKKYIDFKAMRSIQNGDIEYYNPFMEGVLIENSYSLEPVTNLLKKFINSEDIWPKFMYHIFEYVIVNNSNALNSSKDFLECLKFDSMICILRDTNVTDYNNQEIEYSFPSTTSHFAYSFIPPNKEITLRDLLLDKI